MARFFGNNVDSAICFANMILAAACILLPFVIDGTMKNDGVNAGSKLPRLLAICVSILIPACVYVMSCPPTVYLVDSGSFTVAAHHLGIAHPPGFPAYVFTGWLFFKIPIQLSHAGRLNILSALMGTLTVHLVWKTGDIWFRRSPLHKRMDLWVRELPPLLGAMVATFTWPIWMYSTIAEVYTLTSSALLGSIVLVSMWKDSLNFQSANAKTSRGSFLPCAWQKFCLISAGVCFGVACSAHHVTAALALPALCYIVFEARPRSSIENISLCGIAAVVTIGGFYGAMFAVGMQDPLWNWGGVTSFSRLINHVIGKQYSVNLAAHVQWETIMLESKRLAWMCLFSFTPSGIVVAALSWPRAWAPFPTHSRLGVEAEKRMLVILLVFALAFYYVYIISEDKEGYLMTTSWSFGLACCLGSAEYLAGLGFCSPVDTASDPSEGGQVKPEVTPSLPTSSWGSDIGSRIGTSNGVRRRTGKSGKPAAAGDGKAVETSTTIPPSPPQSSSRTIRALGVLLLLLGPAMAALHNWTRGGCYRPHDDRASRIVKEATANLPVGSILFTKEFQFYSPWLELHHVQGYRPDLVVVDLLLARMSWYLDYLHKHAPSLMDRVRKEEKAYRKKLALFEEGLAYDGNKIQQAFVAFLNALLRETRHQGGQVFYMLQLGQREMGVGDDLAWLPWGLVVRGVHPTEVVATKQIREACEVLHRYPPQYPWVHHRWDIEGWKLGMLFTQGLAEQARIWDRLSRLTDKEAHESRSAPSFPLFSAQSQDEASLGEGGAALAETRSSRAQHPSQPHDGHQEQGVEAVSREEAAEVAETLRDHDMLLMHFAPINVESFYKAQNRHRPSH